MAAAQIRLGLIGYGEIGSTLGRGLRQSGLAKIASYDKGAFAGPFSDLIRRRAQEAGVTLVGSPVELAGCADVILGVTPGSASLESAAAFAPHINATHLFVDVASATPKVKQAVADRLRASDAVIGDASIVGTPRDGHAMPILASGPGAEPMRDALTPWGMRIEPVGPEIGSASGIKILRSVVTKGLEALLVECILGARRYGVNDVVLASLGKTLSRPFAEVVNGLLTTDVIHAARRAEEAAMSAEALADIGIEPLMTRATAARLDWVAGLGLKERLGGVVPANWSDAIVAIETEIARIDNKR